jgi:hypothetical protein
MSCDEIEALRLGLLTVLGTENESVRRHAEDELGEALEEGGPISALANSDSLSELQRHLDSALIELEDEVATADSESADSGYVRGRLLAVRDAERSLARLTDSGETFLSDLGETHHTLHETFPTDE